MARTQVPLTTNTGNAFTVRPAGTAADPTNDHYIDTSAVAVEEITIEFTQTDATARAATIVAGGNPPALEAGQGDLTQSMAQNAVYNVRINSGRYRQANGQIYINLDASFAGTIRAYYNPRNV